MDKVIPKGSRIDFKFHEEDFEELHKTLDGLSLNHLVDVEWDDIPLGALCLPSLRWAMRRFNLPDNTSTRRLMRQYILGAANVVKTVKGVIQQEKPHSFVIFNGQSYPEAVTKFVAERMRVPAVTHEVGARPFSAFFSHREATSYRINIPEGFYLTSDLESQLDQYLEQRTIGKFSMAGINFWPEMSSLSDEFLSRVSEYDRVVTVFTNVIFDTSQAHANVYFSDQYEWLEYLIDLTSKYPKTLFIFRAHPDETRPGKESRESVAMLLENIGALIQPNIYFISPDQYMSSYELIRKSDFILTYNSTIGLEASILGKGVLCAGRARFTDYATVYFPTSLDEYKSTLRIWLDGGNMQPSDEMVSEARRFLYYQLYRTSLDFSRYLEPAPGFPGQVRFQRLQVMDLHPSHSQEMDVIEKGILEGAPFHYSSDLGEQDV
jgi:hypothetical protein